MLSTTLMVNSSGFIHWAPSCQQEIQCDVDVAYFPFDRHQCRLELGSWSYHGGSLEISRVSISRPTVQQVFVISHKLFEYSAIGCFQELSY